MTKSATRIQDKDTQKRVSVVQSKEDPSKYWVVILNPDGTPIRWKQGIPWEAATIAVWTTATWQPWTSASVTNSWTSSAAVFNFTIPEGEQGEKGETGNGIASVTSSKSWKTTTITITFTDGSTPYSFQLLDWADWQWSWDVIWPSSSTQGHLATFADGTGKVIQDWWAIPVVPTNVSAFTNDAWYVTSSIVSDTAYGSSWDWVTWTAPSKNAVYDKINGIDWLIPSAATSSNKLTDKNYVDDSINSVTAYYITKNAAGDQFATYAELAAATTFYSGWVVRVPTRNDYCIVLDDENHDHATTRYIYNTNWEYQYTVNETALTTAQINALNSWITSAKVTTYDGYASTISWKQDALTTQTAYTSKGTSTKVPTITTNTLGQVTWITETSIAFPVTSVNGSTGSVTVSEFNPWGTATTGYVLKKTADWYWWDAESWAVTSVNWQTGAVTVSEFTPTSAGTTDQVLTKTANWYDWAAPAASGIVCDPNSPITITKIRCWTESQYSNLWTYDSSTAYMTI